MGLATATDLSVCLADVSLQRLQPFWTMAIVGALVSIRDTIPEKLLAAMARHKVTHPGAAPIVLRMLCDSPDAPAHLLVPNVRVLTAGATTACQYGKGSTARSLRAAGLRADRNLQRD